MDSSKPAEQAPLLLREERNGVVTLRMNRPSQFNALSEAMLDALQNAFDAVAADPAVRCVVLAGEGKAFCAGHDLREMRAQPDLDYYKALFARCRQRLPGRSWPPAGSRLRWRCPGPGR